MIRLDDLLKLTGIADSGGHAKKMVQGGEVKVNGEVDTRRGRKLHLGDRVEASGQTIAVDEALLSRSSGGDEES
jgi:ribosome-associated protein